jgi:hypothetical protein
MGWGCVNDAGNEAGSAQCFLAESLPKRLWERCGNGGEPRDLHRTGGGAGACPVGIVTPKVGKYVAEKEKVIVPTGEANEPRSNGE